jgi:hypothetical protein
VNNKYYLQQIQNAGKSDIIVLEIMKIIINKDNQQQIEGNLFPENVQRL